MGIMFILIWLYAFDTNALCGNRKSRMWLIEMHRDALCNQTEPWGAARMHPPSDSHLYCTRVWISPRFPTKAAFLTAAGTHGRRDKSIFIYRDDSSEERSQGFCLAFAPLSGSIVSAGMRNKEWCVSEEGSTVIKWSLGRVHTSLLPRLVLHFTALILHAWEALLPAELGRRSCPQSEVGRGVWISVGTGRSRACLGALGRNIPHRPHRSPSTVPTLLLLFLFLKPPPPLRLCSQRAHHHSRCLSQESLHESSLEDQQQSTRSECEGWEGILPGEMPDGV